jgi:hypothetical protein
LETLVGESHSKREIGRRGRTWEVNTKLRTGKWVVNVCKVFENGVR